MISKLVGTMKQTIIKLFFLLCFFIICILEILSSSQIILNFGKEKLTETIYLCNGLLIIFAAGYLFFDRFLSVISRWIFIHLLLLIFIAITIFMDFSEYCVWAYFAYILYGGYFNLSKWAVMGDYLNSFEIRNALPACISMSMLGWISIFAACSDSGVQVLNIEENNNSSSDGMINGLQLCGDGIINGLELCDDGNQESGDGCSRDCKELELGYICEGLPNQCLFDSLIDNSSIIEGYTDYLNTRVGGKANFYVHSPSGKFSLYIYSDSQRTNLIDSVEDITGSKQNYRKFSYQKGCDWNATYQLSLSENKYKPSIYAVVLKDQTSKFTFPMVVSADEDNISTYQVLIVTPTNTWQAYNDWGGASFYKNDVFTERRYSNFISYNRPLSTKLHYEKRDSHIQNYLISQNIDSNVITDLDLHYSGIPESTKVLFLNSHPEYFSEKMYDEIDTYLAQGGNLVNLGGNAIYWKVTLKENQMEVRKQRNKKMTQIYIVTMEVLVGSGDGWVDLSLQSFVGNIQLQVIVPTHSMK